LGGVSNKGSAYRCSSSRNTRHVDLMYEENVLTSKKVLAISSTLDDRLLAVLPALLYFY
jgi:hypothetical protein